MEGNRASRLRFKRMKKKTNRKQTKDYNAEGSDKSKWGPYSNGMIKGLGSQTKNDIVACQHHQRGGRQDDVPSREKRY
ncbi:hypothetical protein NDU88_006352 [Pleurodeles waltl]|uniref:Uncharacterized protein n=1 Tax=Pleurodeles waltl TaxID=8319 RepID=A0AAV7NTV8_PLEWA|nr:hypothetical protein NDU88_006352 [Pleurodeles waltl]